MSAPDIRPADDPSRPVVANQVEVLAATETAVKATARISGLAGCVKTTKTVKVTGTQLRSVAFTLDGRKLKTVKARGGVAATKVTVAGLKAGTHKLTAKVTFANGAKAKTLTIRFSRCSTAAVTPHFTG